LDDPGLDIAAGEEFLQEVFQILLEEGVRKSMDVTQKVCDWKKPQELRELLDLELRSDGEGRERLLQRCRDVLRLSVRTGHPRFCNQLFSGLDHHALAGRFLTETLNTSPYTYEVAPVLVLMEEQVLAKLRELVGWSSGDGIFAPAGGSMSNMLAMNVARFRRFPESRSRGNWDLPRLGLFASRESHYSILKGAALLGIGTDNVHLVRTDERGKMIPEELEKEIQRVKAEVRRVCTPPCPPCPPNSPVPPQYPQRPSQCPQSSLNVRVSSSKSPKPLQCCPKFCFFPPTRADSVTWNPHKLLMVGLQCSAFLLRDSSVGAPHPEFLPRGCLPGPLINLAASCSSQGLLQRCHGVGASYLFQRDKFYDVSLDTGDKSPQCGRRADGLKLWILWKAVGTRGLGWRVERAFAATRYLLEQMKRREGFRLVMEPEFLNLCFWFIPPSLRGQDSSPEFWDKLGKVAPAIKEKMIRRGSMMVGYQPQGSRVNFFRQVIINPAVTRQDLDFFLDEIQELGWDL
ncbi:CSAD decarboxylase, partial [Phainopepla nitens]|nr:CSAD decarboxylase [Phainopepla nitens]